ncbi:hypothetical protein SOCE26_068270 [Sorangium cellulosum]|uniref:TonB-dependent receptor n=1 Tax=Sorangium cellulosum TaxID=56 RepID=A0A2L0F1A3_SORCE|nr:PEGA domain-containing protein [Sorangium cellulosum]AUX45345.1 hypothetical protein SOCE26_068270 [Sorangium cellulosum]
MPTAREPLASSAKPPRPHGAPGSTPRCARRPARALAALLAASIAASGARAARADGLADEAELHFEIGRERFKRGDYRGAIEHFLASNRLVPNRNVVFNIALGYEELNRFADAHRYYIDARLRETNPQMLADIDAAIARIAPQVAVLRIETTPPGATIYLDRLDLGSRGSTPRPLAVPEGRYRILLALDGHELAVVEGVDARLGQEALVAVPLTRIVGTVRALSRGAEGADVRVDRADGEVACQAPCSVDLPPGRHTLYFSRDGFQTARQEVTVAPREVVEVTAALSPLTGSVLVRTNEREALIEIDGRSVGFTPAVIQGVPAGRRHVRLSLHGFNPIERDIDVNAGQQAELVDLRMIPSRQVEAASRYRENIDDAPASVSVVEQRELRAFGYPTLAEALRGVRGVYLSNDHDLFTFGIRGLGEPGDYNSRVLLLSDGHPLNDNVMNGALFTGAEGRAGLNDVYHIEVIRGPGSLLYGTGAFSGVINIVPFPRDTQTGVYAGAGAYDDTTLHAHAGFTYRAARDAGVRASVSGARSEGRDLEVELREPEGGNAARTVHGANRFRSGGVVGRAWVGPLTAQWFWGMRTKRMPAGMVSALFDDPRTVYDDHRMMAELRFEPRVSDEVHILARAHVNHATFHGEFAPTSVEDYTSTWLGGELRAVWAPRPSWRLTAGGELQVHPQATMLGKQEDVTYVDVHKPHRSGAGYVVAEGSLLAWLRLSAGARVDVNSLFDPVVTSRLAAIAKPWPGGLLKLMGGNAFRAPGIFERHYTTVGQRPGVDPASELDLEPELALTGEAELSHRFDDDWVGLVAGHVSRISEFITAAPDTPGEMGEKVVRNVNVESPAFLAGAELELRREWREGWMLGASYGYERAKYADTGNTMFNIPEHLGSVRAVVPLLGDAVTAALRVSLEAPRRISVEGDARTRGGVVADLAFSGELPQFHARYVLGMYNLTNTRYEYPVKETFHIRTSPQSGRTVLLDLAVSYP